MRNLKVYSSVFKYINPLFMSVLAAITGRVRALLGIVAHPLRLALKLYSNMTKKCLYAG